MEACSASDNEPKGSGKRGMNLHALSWHVKKEQKLGSWGELNYARKTRSNLSIRPSLVERGYFVKGGQKEKRKQKDSATTWTMKKTFKEG